MYSPPAVSFVIYYGLSSAVVLTENMNNHIKIAIYSIVLNHHQAPVADELYKILGDSFKFVELSGTIDSKGGTENYSQRSYLLCAWRSQEELDEASHIACSAECCIFSSVQSLPFMRKRMKLGLLSFDMSERWLKKGMRNLLSPAILQMYFAYKLGNWKTKPLYKLCCSAFARDDHKRLGMYIDKCYKWGYFTQSDKIDIEISRNVFRSEITTFMWCSRYLMLKHPELPILLAQRLKSKGYAFHLDMYGEGKYKQTAKKFTERLGLQDKISFYGNKPNDALMEEMSRHSVFLFTSDRNEGWGAVANESMAHGCVLVSSDAVGSAPYLIIEKKTGVLFTAPQINSSFANPDMKALDDLCSKVEWLIHNPDKSKTIGMNAKKLLCGIWSPAHAAQSLIRLISDLSNGQETSIADGPCSKA